MEGIEEFALPSSLIRKKSGTHPDKGMVLEYVNILEGYKTKFKNLHWSAEKTALHEKVDEFLEELDTYEDAVSEDVQATVGSFAESDIKPKECSHNDAMSAIKMLWKDTLNFRKKIEGKEDYLGVVGLIDGMLHTIKKYIYLFRMCPKMK